jgi:hypothetical protein
MEPSSESLRRDERPGNAKIKVEHSSSTLQQPSQSLTGSQRSGYTSQSKVLASKAFEKGVDMSEFRKIMNEKEDIAQARFPGESADWRTWLAESMVWSFYCKVLILPLF